jgi:1,4-alpha-glucan branching enzyme
MKILLLSRSMPWHAPGGLEHHVWDIARGLGRQGHEVHLLTTPAAPQRPAPDPPPRLRLHALPRGAPGRYSIPTFRAFARQALRLDREIGFDVINSQGFAAYAFPKRLAPRLAVAIHGTLTSETLLHGPLFRSLGLGAKLAAVWRHKGRLATAPLYGRLLRLARVILVDSKFTRQELLRTRPWLEPKIRVAPLGISPERAPRAPTAPRRLVETPVRLLSVGRLTAAKGMDVALKALAKVPAGQWRWQVAGAGPQLDALRREASELGLDENVEFLGQVDEERLAACRARSDLALAPELGCPAFGLVALEALLAGLPVVATDRGALPEVVQPDSGWLVPPGDPQALADRLADLFDHPALIDARAAGCRQRALERFSYEDMIDKTCAALAEAGGAQT